MESAEAGHSQLRGFWSLILTQFEGAFNDNALKMVVMYVGLNMALSKGFHDALVPLTAGLFSLPFILFSMAGGFLADRFTRDALAEAITRALSDRVAWEHASAAGRVWAAKEGSWSGAEQRLLRLYADVLGSTDTPFVRGDER